MKVSDITNISPEENNKIFDRAVSKELFFDDDPVEEIIKGIQKTSPTPTHIIKILRNTKKLTESHCKYIISVLQNHPDDIALLFNTMNENQSKFFQDKVNQLYEDSTIINFGFLQAMSNYFINVGSDHKAFGLYKRAFELKLAEENKMHKSALESEPNNLEKLNEYALFLKNKCHNFIEAEKIYEKILLLKPYDNIYLHNYAVLLMRKIGHKKRAEEYFNRSLQINPNHPNTLSNLANLYFSYYNEREKAESLYLRAIKLAPDLASVRVNYATLLIEQNRYTEANDQLITGWKSIGSNHSHISTRVLFTKAILESICKLEYSMYIGQLKSLLTQNTFHTLWTLAPSFNVYLKNKLAKNEYAFFKALFGTMLSWKKIATLTKYKIWSNQRPVSLSNPWAKI